eukprot:160710-Prorocentrum_minimum.AAC.1
MVQLAPSCGHSTLGTPIVQVAPLVLLKTQNRVWNHTESGVESHGIGWNHTKSGRINRKKSGGITRNRVESREI